MQLMSVIFKLIVEVARPDLVRVGSVHCCKYKTNGSARKLKNELKICSLFVNCNSTVGIKDYRFILCPFYDGKFYEDNKTKLFNDVQMTCSTLY